MNDSTKASSAQALTIIYGALAAGVFLFAAIVLLVLEPIDSVVDPTVMRLVWFGLAAVAVFGAGIVRGRLAGGDPQRSRTGAIVVWALAEGQALVGIVGTMITGDRIMTYGALAIFVWIWLRYPPRSFLSD